MVLITTIGDDLSLTITFIKYYSKMCKTIIFLINSEDYNNTINHLRKFESFFNSTKFIFIKFSGEFSETRKVSLEHKAIRDHIKDDYILYADSDEFIYFPGGLENRIKLMHQFGENFIEGRMIDRLSFSGNLKVYNYLIPLEEQFPIGSDITKSICGAWNKKIVLAHSDIKLGGGHHVIFNKNGVEYNGTKVQPYIDELPPWSYGVELHHFKWNSNLLNKLIKQLQYKSKSLNSWKNELNRFIVNSGNHYLPLEHIKEIESENWFIDLRFSHCYYIGSKLGV